MPGISRAGSLKNEEHSYMPGISHVVCLKNEGYTQIDVTFRCQNLLD